MKARAFGVAVALVFVAARADAAPSGNESSIIGNPGEHPDYHLEIEPHGLLAFGGPFNAWRGNFGAGVRATFPLIGNGPIPSINNNLGIGVGADFFVFNGAALFVPVVGQWNFFLLSHFSLFLEAGLVSPSAGCTTWTPSSGLAVATTSRSASRSPCVSSIPSTRHRPLHLSLSG